MKLYIVVGSEYDDDNDQFLGHIDKELSAFSTYEKAYASVVNRLSKYDVKEEDIYQISPEQGTIHIKEHSFLWFSIIEREIDKYDCI